MAIPAAVKKQVAKAEEISAALNKAEKPQGEPTEEPKESLSEPNLEELPPIEELLEEKAAPPEELTEEETWEKRYKNFKTTTDDTLRKQREALKAREDALTQFQARERQREAREAAMAAEVEALRKTQPAFDARDFVRKQLSEEDIDVLGDEGVAAIAKGTSALVDSATSPLRQRLDRMEQYQREEFQRQQQAQVNTRNMTAKQKTEAVLDKAVPDWSQYDHDPAFKQWMGESDLSGSPRLTLFNNAFHSGDVERVTSFYREWDAKKNGGRTPESRIAPKSQSTNTVPTSKPNDIWDNARIARYYQDKKAGKFSTERIAAIEEELKIAARDHRIVR